jgi:tetratricopeptide (TPR) repeat protein
MKATTRPRQLPDLNTLLNSGWLQHQQGKLIEAKAIYEKVLATHPAHSEALHLLGIIALDSSNPSLAIDLVTRSIESNPDNAAAYSSLGKALKAINQPDEAIVCYNTAISLRPKFAEVYYNKANLLQFLNRLDEAILSYDLAIKYHPKNAGAYCNKGQALYKLGRLHDAIESYDSAIALKNDHSGAYLGRGLAQQELRDFEKAVKNYDKAIEINSSLPEAYFNRAIALQNLKRFEAAIESYDRSIDLNADFVQAYLNRGVLHKEMGDLDKAISSYKHALKIQGNYADAYANLGMALKDLGSFVEANINLDKAIELDKGHAEAITAKSLALLLEGNYDEGWPLFEWRWKKVKLTNSIPPSCPLWLGEDSLLDKTILLRSEQGLGDTIQFCRYAKLVKSLGAKVVLEAPKALLELLTQLDYVDQVIEQGGKVPHVDYYCPLLSLPLAFKTNIESIPTPFKYLASHPQKLAQWSETLGSKTKLRVGLVWSGNKQHGNDRNRSISLAKIIQYLPEDIEFISLQKEVREEDKATLSLSSIQNFDVKILDFLDTAALCDLMDIVVSVDTSVAHLAASLGKPTWVLLPYVPDWRWLRNTDASPWYDSVKLYRQNEKRSWEDVFDRVRSDLLHFNGSF